MSALQSRQFGDTNLSLNDQISFGIDSNHSQDFSVLANHTQLNQVFSGSAKSLLLGSDQIQAGMHQSFESKILNLYQHDYQSQSRQQAKKPSYRVEKQLATSTKSALQMIQSLVGQAVNKISSKKINLTFILRRLQWLSFYYESVRRQRMIQIIRNSEQQRNKMENNHLALQQSVLEQAIIVSNEQFQDLQAHQLRQQKSYSPFQISSMVTGVYVSSILANLATKGHFVSTQQEQVLYRYFSTLHQQQFADPQTIELSIMVPPVSIEAENLSEIMAIIEQPLTSSEAISLQLQRINQQDMQYQQMINGASAEQRVFQGMVAKDPNLEQALHAGQTILDLLSQPARGQDGVQVAGIHLPPELAHATPLNRDLTPQI